MPDSKGENRWCYASALKGSVPTDPYKRRKYNSEKIRDNEQVTIKPVCKTAANKNPVFQFKTKSQDMLANKKPTDIQKFIEKFEPSKFKMLSRGIEVRGIKDLNKSISLAKEVIEKLKLRLVISHSAEMAMYGSFEVIYP